MPKIIWHVNPDDDSKASRWAVESFVPGMTGAEVVSVSGRWDGSGMGPDDIAIDIPAGGRGIKGVVEGNVVHSAFASVVARFAGPEDAEAIKYLVRFIDLKDSRGSVVNALIPQALKPAKWLIANSDMGAVLRAINNMHTRHERYQEGGETRVRVGSSDVETIFQRAKEIFDGFLALGRESRAAEEGIDPAYMDYFLLRPYREMRDARNIQAVIRFYDIKENHPDVIGHLLGDADDETKKVFAKNSIDAVLMALQHVHKDDEKTFLARVREILDGFVKMDEIEEMAKEDAKRAEWFAEGRVAFIKDGLDGTGDVLRRQGAIVVVYQDGINLGVVVKGRPCWFNGERLRADHSIFRAATERAGDPPDLWFAHPSGMLYCNGSRKAPTDVLSKVSPTDLIQAAVKLLSK